MKFIASFFVLLIFSFGIYSQNNLPIGSSIEFWSTKWDSTYKEKLTYDANHSITLYELFRYEPFPGDWVYNIMYEYQNDNSGKRELETRYSWNGSSAMWDTLSKFYTNYYPNGRKAAVEFLYHSGGWNYVSIDSNFYDSNGDMVLTRIYYFNNTKEIYEHMGNWHYNYSNGKIETFLYEWQDTANLKWDTISRIRYLYDAINNTDTAITENYTNGQFEFQSRKISSYNQDGDLVEELNHDYNASTGEWDNNSKQNKTYLLPGVSDVDIWETWEPSSSTYKNYSRKKFFYNEFVGMNEIDPIYWRFYPNPTQDEIRIEGIERTGILNIYDLSGKLVKNKILSSGNNRVNLSNLNSGTYIIEIENHREILIIE